jgi:hypothetical protein
MLNCSSCRQWGTGKLKVKKIFETDQNKWRMNVAGKFCMFISLFKEA